MIAAKYGLQTYHYDQHDLSQLEKLAQKYPRYRAFLDASLDERWVSPRAEDLLRFVMRSFQDRFPLVVEDLLELPQEPMIVAEGFGFTPESLLPVLTSKRQAIWLVPTEEFKWASMERRNKPSFSDAVSDPERATRNVFKRDMLLAKQVRAQAESRGLTVLEVDGSRPVELMAATVQEHFEPLLRNANGEMLQSALVEDSSPKGG
jgi:hypothetical protein